jgi:hypothetical protein
VPAQAPLLEEPRAKMLEEELLLLLGLALLLQGECEELLHGE